MDGLGRAAGRLGTLAVLATVLFTVVTMSEAQWPRTTSDWDGAYDRQSGVSARYPANWAVQRFGRHCMRGGPGFIVSNAPGLAFARAEIPNGCTTAWDMRGAPESLAAVEVAEFYSPFTDSRWTDMPLSLRAARTFTVVDDITSRVLSVHRGRRVYFVHAYFGPKAPPRDEALAERVVASVRFTSQS